MNLNVHKASMVDTHYLSLWDKNDLPLVEKMQAKIRAHDHDVSNEFFDIMERRWNDHKPTPEALDISRDDKYVVTYKGIGYMCRLVTQQANLTFRYVAVGTGAPAGANPMPFEQDLTGESDAVDVLVSGFFDATGTSLRYGGTFGSLMESDNYNESLIRTTPNFGDTGRVSLCIANFQDNPINHSSGSTGFTAAGSVEFNIVMDIGQPEA